MDGSNPQDMTTLLLVFMGVVGSYKLLLLKR